MLRFVREKPLKTESVRRLAKTRRQTDCVVRKKLDFALELDIVCATVGFEGDILTYKAATPFVAMVDTGFSGELAISDYHYDKYCDTEDEHLIEAEGRSCRLADSSIVHPREYLADFWILPWPQSDEYSPIRVSTSHGIDVYPVNESPELPEWIGDAYIGMACLKKLQLHLEVDFRAYTFSLLLPD